ncbi:MAG: phosphoribosylglycinamide formyltransferase [Alphaproteobacteria bacterium]|nr:phosphoribosylglycinamide formyltransferase [Alphaproteobacteria bacterium]
MARLKVAVMISGRGSNLQALIDAAAEPSFPAEIALVISNVPGAKGLERATRSGIDAQVVDHRDFATREDFEHQLDRALSGHHVELVCLAGFMRILTPSFVGRWHDRLVNIHPSLLPKHKGLDTHARALEAGDVVSGCTIYFVRPDMDAGPIIVQTEVEIRPGDTEEQLAARVLEAEHRSYPRAVKAIAEGRVRVVGDRVEIEGGL